MIHFLSLLSVGPIPRINQNNANYTANVNRGQRAPPSDLMPYNDTTNKAHINNTNNPIDLENKNMHKHKSLRSPTKSSTFKSSGKMSNSSNNGSSKSKSSSLSKSSSSKSERSSRSTSSSSSSKKSKNRKDDKSPRK